MWWTSIHSAANVLCGSQDFFGGSAQFTGHRTWSQCTGNADNVIQWDVAIVFNCARNNKDLIRLCFMCDGWIVLYLKTMVSGMYLLFLTFFLSRGGSFNALMISEAADGTTEMAAWRFWMVKHTVILRPFQSPVALAMSSPIFFGDYNTNEKKKQIFIRFQMFTNCFHHSLVICTHNTRLFSLTHMEIGCKLTKPNGPIFGANDDVAPTSPPTQRRYTKREQEKEAEYYFYALVKQQHNQNRPWYGSWFLHKNSLRHNSANFANFPSLTKFNFSWIELWWHFCLDFDDFIVSMTKDDSDNLRFSARTNTAIELISSTCDVEKNDGRFEFDVYAWKCLEMSACVTMCTQIDSTDPKAVVQIIL